MTCVYVCIIKNFTMANKSTRELKISQFKIRIIYQVYDDMEWLKEKVQPIGVEIKPDKSRNIPARKRWNLAFNA